MLAKSRNNSNRGTMEIMEHRLTRLEDERQIHRLAASFADACTLGDIKAFKRLWTSDGIWKPGPPFAVQHQGIDGITELIHKLASGREFFHGFIHSRVDQCRGCFFDCTLDSPGSCERTR